MQARDLTHTSREFDFLERKYNPDKDIQIMEQNFTRITSSDVRLETSKKPSDWMCHEPCQDVPWTL